MRYISGTADLRIQQPFDEPYLRLRVERTKAEQLGFTAHDIAQNLLVSLSGSFQTSPSFWVDPNNHVSYQIATQTPQYRTDTLQDLENIPITGIDPAAPPSIMASLVSLQRGTGMAVVSHYNVAPVIDIYGAATGRDLGGVAGDINKIVNSTRQQLPRGSRVELVKSTMRPTCGSERNRLPVPAIVILRTLIKMLHNARNAVLKSPRLMT